MEKIDVNERIYLNSFINAFNTRLAIGNTGAIHHLRNAAICGKGVKNISVGLHMEIANYADGLTKLMANYANHYGLTKLSKKEIYGHMMEKIDELYKTEKTTNVKPEIGFYRTPSYGIQKIATFIANVIIEIDRSIAWVQAATKVNDVKDERFDKSSFKDLFVNYECLSTANKNIDAIEADISKLNVGKPFSSEHGKAAIKLLRALKSDTISCAKKYFGPSSEFAEFNFVDLISM